MTNDSAGLDIAIERAEKALDADGWTLAYQGVALQYQREFGWTCVATVRLSGSRRRADTIKGRASASPGGAVDSLIDSLPFWRGSW